jgi:lipoprotein signal peptidase
MTAKNNKNNTLDQIDRFHRTRQGRIVFGLAELLVAYLFVSLAIESGSIWQYIAAALLTLGGVNNLIRAFVLEGIKQDGKKPAKKR